MSRRTSTAQPFHVHWEADALARVRDQVRHARLPRAPVDAGWRYGCDPQFLQRLRAHWLDGFDPYAAVAELNRYPQVTVEIDGLQLHAVHVVGEAGGKRPLILTHGWPGSIYEFWQVIEPLAYPTSRGGRREDAFDLVIPSLPGFGFSSKPERPIGTRTTAKLFDQLMREVLGYQTYLAQGGDWVRAWPRGSPWSTAARCRPST